jgi:hypothetical protein
VRAAGLVRRLAPVLGANAVPVAGVFAAGWTGATALTLYWCETLVASLLVLARLALHRRLTRKRGYTRLQLGMQTTSELTVAGRTRHRREARPARSPGVRLPGSFVAEFAAAACAATLLHGAMLWFLLRSEGADVQRDALAQGLLGVAAFQALGFLLDLRGLRQRPFAWARQVAETTVHRVMLIHLALIAGFWFAGAGGKGFFGPFAVLKALADVGNALERLGFRADTEEAPAWLVAVVSRLRRDGDFAEHWRAERAAKRSLQEEDETVAARR